MDQTAKTSDANSTVNSQDSNNDSANLNNSQRKEEINKEIKSYIRKRHPFSFRNFFSKLAKPFRKKEITKEKIEDTILENPVQKIEVYEVEKTGQISEHGGQQKISGQISEPIEPQQKKAFFFGLSNIFKKKAEKKLKDNSLKEYSEYELSEPVSRMSEEQENDMKDSLKITVEAIKLIPRENFDSFRKTEYFERYKKLLQKYEIKKL